MGLGGGLGRRRFVDGIEGRVVQVKAAAAEAAAHGMAVNGVEESVQEGVGMRPADVPTTATGTPDDRDALFCQATAPSLKNTRKRGGASMSRIVLL
jgi:hypothetical protein